MGIRKGLNPRKHRLAVRRGMAVRCIADYDGDRPYP